MMENVNQNVQIKIQLIILYKYARSKNLDFVKNIVKNVIMKYVIIFLQNPQLLKVNKVNILNFSKMEKMMKKKNLKKNKKLTKN